MATHYATAGSTPLVKGALYARAPSAPTFRLTVLNHATGFCKMKPTSPNGHIRFISTETLSGWHRVPEPT